MFHYIPTIGYFTRKKGVVLERKPKPILEIARLVARDGEVTPAIKHKVVLHEYSFDDPP
jgi:hypothetical protein